MVDKQLLITKLINGNGNYITAAALAEEFLVSTKTIRKTIMSLNDELKRGGAAIISKPNRGYCLVINDFAKFSNYLVDKNEEEGGAGYFDKDCQHTTLVNYQFRKHGWTIKMPDGVPEVVSEVFQSLIAGTVVIATVWLVTCVCGININNVITTALTPLQALLNNAWGIGLIVFLMCLLWCIGLHESLFYGVVYPVALANMALNTTAFLANEAAPTIFTQQFFGFNLWLGGSGGTLGLCILLCTSKSRSLKALGRIAAPATVFQINEPITFGVPVVFNPILAIPYCVFPAVAAVSTYYLMQFNIIGRTVAAVSLQTPPILFPYLATGGDIPATIWYCVLIVLSILMYLPFFKVYEKKRIDDEKAGAFSEID